MELGDHQRRHQACNACDSRSTQVDGLSKEGFPEKVALSPETAECEVLG